MCDYNSYSKVRCKYLDQFQMHRTTNESKVQYCNFVVDSVDIISIKRLTSVNFRFFVRFYHYFDSMIYIITWGGGPGSATR